jgi:hypothetical protein
MITGDSMFRGNAFSQDGQRFLFSEATKLAVAGEEFSHLMALLDPDRCMRLRAFVRDLPDEVREKTVCGRALAPTTSTRKSKK